MDPENPQAPAEAGPKPPRAKRSRAAAKKRPTKAARRVSKKAAAAKPGKARKGKTNARNTTRARIGAGLTAAGNMGRKAKNAVANTTVAASKSIGRALREEKEKGFPKAKAIIVVGGLILDVALIAREMTQPSKSKTKLAQKALDALGKTLR